jgi:translation initiation factor IF-2
VPEAGEQLFAIVDEKTAKEIARVREEKARQSQMQPVQRISLENLYAQIKEGVIKELKIILKADVMGSLGAIKESLKKIETPEIKLTIIHEGAGDINSSDVILAAVSNALILGFSVGTDIQAKELIAREGVDLRSYNIIYELTNDLKAALEGMLEPKIKKLFLGRAEVRKVFKLSRAGVVAGCFVSKGKILRSSTVNLMRNGQSVFEGKISALKRFKDDVKEVGEGVECGVSLVDLQEIQEGDVIEAYEIQKIARKLE